MVASRLSEDPDVSVLVLEKGCVNDNFLSRIPLLSQNYRFPNLGAVARVTEPIGEVGGRRARIWTAEAVGGATRVNAMLLTRGVPAGFNEWAERFGLADWSWEKVEPFFRKSENAVGHPDAAHRGHGGPVENCQPPPELAFYPYYEKMAEAVGLPVHRDLNDPAAPAQGYFYLDMAIDRRGNRVSAYRAWLNRRIANERREHLTVCTGVVASKLEVDEKGKQVTGVYIRHAGPGRDKKDFFVRARREVIICSGSLCSPQLLMLRYGAFLSLFLSTCRRYTPLTFHKWHRPKGPSRRQRNTAGPRVARSREKPGRPLLCSRHDGGSRQGHTSSN